MQKLEKIYSCKKNKFFCQKLQFTYLWASIENVLVTEEAFRPKKRTSSTSKHEISKFVTGILFWVIFVLLDRSGYGSTDLIESGPDPDPKHCKKLHTYIPVGNLIIFFFLKTLSTLNKSFAVLYNVLQCSIVFL